MVIFEGFRTNTLSFHFVNNGGSGMAAIPKIKINRFVNSQVENQSQWQSFNRFPYKTQKFLISFSYLLDVYSRIFNGGLSVHAQLH